MFCKIFGKGDDQILVMLDNADTGEPQVVVCFQPEGMEVCKINLTYTDTPENRQKAQEMLEGLTEAQAREYVARATEHVSDMVKTH